MENKLEKFKQTFDFENVLVKAMKVPGVVIERDLFLRQVLAERRDEGDIEKAISFCPAKAGFSKKTIDEIAKKCLFSETGKVTALSGAASFPGGLGAPIVAVADVTSYFAFLIRAIQMMGYLYGFQDLSLKANPISEEEMNRLMVFLGVMYEVEGAEITLHRIADDIADAIASIPDDDIVTNEEMLPVAERVHKFVGTRITRQMVADMVASAIPLAAPGLSGGLTFSLYKTRCKRLVEALSSYRLCEKDNFL